MFEEDTVGAVMMVSQDGSGQWRGQNGEARPEQPERYKVSYGQTPDVKMGQKLYHLGPELLLDCWQHTNMLSSEIKYLCRHSPLQSPPVLMMSDLRWRTTTLKPDC